jgi:two-component system sensor histidine kinase CreC
LAVSQGQRGQLNPDKIVSHELRHLAQALETMRLQLEGKAYVERYVQTLTHELKSPLAGIKAAAELLQEPMPVAKQQQFVDIIQGDSERLQRLIERVLNLAKLEQQQALIEVQSVCVSTLIESVLTELRTRTEHLLIDVKTDFAMGPKVSIDVFLMRQALLNIVDNALDFISPKGTLRVLLEYPAPWVQIRVFNTGQAIPDYALPRLTERFYSLARPLTGKKSTGLGLNFVQEIAHLHHGDVTIANCPEGVEVTLRFLTSPNAHTTPI